MTVRTFSYGMPSSSAAIWLMAAREPPMSGLPSITLTVPSAVMLSDTQVSPPKLNQKPQATPRPWFGPNGALRCGCALAVASVAVSPILSKLGP